MNPIQHGRDAMFFGELMDYRRRLGLSKMAVAMILGVRIQSLYNWESFGLLTKINNRNAEAVHLFITEAEKVLADFPGFADRFIHLGVATQRMALTQEVIISAINDGTIWAWDFGYLGLFFERDRLREYRKAIIAAL